MREQIRGEVQTVLHRSENRYITCQSFLIIAFSSAMSNQNVYFRLGVGLILPTLGIITSILIKPSIDGAIAIINKWGAKEYEVLQNEDLKDFKIKRAYEKVNPNSHFNIEQRTDIIQRESLKFAKLIPSTPRFNTPDFSATKFT